MIINVILNWVKKIFIYLFIIILLKYMVDKKWCPIDIFHGRQFVCLSALVSFYCGLTVNLL